MKMYLWSLGLIFQLLLGSAFAQMQKPGHLSDRVYLNTTRLAPGALNFFIKAFQAPQAPALSTVNAALEALDSDASMNNIAVKYHQQLALELGIGPRLRFDSMEAWQAANRTIVRGVGLYVESPVEGAAVWQGINTRLRNGQALTAAQNRSLQLILASLDQLPSISGIIFRGAGLRPESLTRYTRNAVITEPSFTSASVSYNVASGYADVSGPIDFVGRPTAGRISTIFVISAKQASPVTALFADYYFEYEALLRPGTRFKVHHRLTDLAARRSVVFLEQL